MLLSDAPPGAVYTSPVGARKEHTCRRARADPYPSRQLVRRWSWRAPPCDRRGRTGTRRATGGCGGLGDHSSPWVAEGVAWPDAAGDYAVLVVVVPLRMDILYTYGVRRQRPSHAYRPHSRPPAPPPPCPPSSTSPPQAPNCGAEPVAPLMLPPLFPSSPPREPRARTNLRRPPPPSPPPADNPPASPRRGAWATTRVASQELLRRYAALRRGSGAPRSPPVCTRLPRLPRRRRQPSACRLEGEGGGAATTAAHLFTMTRPGHTAAQQAARATLEKGREKEKDTRRRRSRNGKRHRWGGEKEEKSGERGGRR